MIKETSKPLQPYLFLAANIKQQVELELVFLNSIVVLKIEFLLFSKLKLDKLFMQI